LLVVLVKPGADGILALMNNLRDGSSGKSFMAQENGLPPHLEIPIFTAVKALQHLLMGQMGF
jgi:hypothetical protein